MSLVLILAAALLAGCGGDASSPAGQGTEGAAPALALAGAGEEATLPDSSRLALGTLKLEGTANAVTAEQASKLLPLWQALQGGALQNEAETAAVLKQIQGLLTAEQLAAIDAMQLGAEDLASWMQEQGMEYGPPADAGDGAGRSAPPEGMSEEEMAAMRATAQAGGGRPGGGEGFDPPGNMSEEEMVAARATAQAGGGMPAGSRWLAGAGGGQLSLIGRQLIALLSDRAAE
jgi:hypothetical protein